MADIELSAKVVPLGTFPIADANHLLAGLHSAPTEAALADIPVERLVAGETLAIVADTSDVYLYTLDEVWELFFSGSFADDLAAVEAQAASAYSIAVSAATQSDEAYDLAYSAFYQAQQAALYPPASSWKNAVQAIATTNITLSGAQTVDGVTLAGNGGFTSDRVLAAGQTAAAQNGVYQYNSSGAWVRAGDSNTGTGPGLNDVDTYDQILVAKGTHAGELWELQTPRPITVNVTALTYAKRSSSADSGKLLPAGGATGQVLAKATGADFDAEWVDGGVGGAVPAGGTTGQVLAKTSGTDFDTEWTDPAGGTDHGTLAGLGDDDHTQYQLRTEKDAANGYAGLSAGSKITGSQQTYGTGANTACEGNDARLSDARTPASHAYSSHTGLPTLGTSAALNVAASGDAAVGEVVKGNDTRLTNARTPASHAYSSHTGLPTLGTSAALNVAASGDAASGEVVKGNDTRLAPASGSTPGTMSAANFTKLANIEAAADVTDDTNVRAALATATAAIDVNAQQITDLAAGTSAGHAVNKGQLDAGLTITAISGSTADLDPAHVNSHYLRTTNAATPVTLTVRDNADVAQPSGATYFGRHVGAGTLVFAEDTAVNITPTPGYELEVISGGNWCLVRTASDAWDLFGDLVET